MDGWMEGWEDGWMKEWKDEGNGGKKKRMRMVD